MKVMWLICYLLLFIFMLPPFPFKHRMKARVNPFQPCVGFYRATTHLVCTVNVTGLSVKRNIYLKWFFSPVIVVPPHLTTKYLWLLKFILNFQERKLSVAQKTWLFLFVGSGVVIFYNFKCFIKYFLLFYPTKKTLECFS